MPITGFRTNDGNPFAYLQVDAGPSMALGLDTTASNIIKLCVSSTANVTPLSTFSMAIDPAANGDFTITPHGSGAINLKSTAVTTTGGVLQAAITTGAISASKGTNGQILIGATAGSPSWATITAGTGITVTNGANSITIAANGSTVLETITGNTGGAISPTAGNINIVTANATAKFAGAGSTETLDFGLTNLILGSSASGITSATTSVGLGQDALSALVDGDGMTAIGYRALRANTGGNSNTAVGTIALLALNSSDPNGYNTAVGAAAGYQLTTTASYNSLFGPTAGGNYTGTESSNICINHMGVLGDNNTLRIGATTGAGNMSLTKAYICGIDGVNVGSVAKVLTMASDQIGTATITAGTGISISPSANAITVSATGMGAFSWVVTAGGTAGVNTGYFTSNGASLVTITLPAVAAVGDTIRISGLATGGWKLAQQAGQSVNIGSSTTTIGVGGSLASTAQFDAIEIVCCVANTTFNIVSSMGNITVV